MTMKLIRNIPCLSHPIRVLFLDDSRGFLDSLEIAWDKPEGIIWLTDPQEAKKMLVGAEENIFKKTSKVFSDADTDALNEKRIDLDISGIKNLIYDSSRFYQIAIVIVDYQMPTLSGVEFCRLLQEHRLLYKVMLTAEAGKDIAIAAFNEGIIDKFVFKQSENLPLELNELIDQLKIKYFQDLSKPLLSCFESGLPPLLNNKAFITLFNEVLLASEAVEYYLLDHSGSYLFLDRVGEPTWLIIRHSQDFKDQIDVLLSLDAPTQMISSLKAREKLLFLLSEEEYRQSTKFWSQCLFDARPLDSHHWYGIAKGKIKKSIQWDQVKSYNCSPLKNSALVHDS